MERANDSALAELHTTLSRIRYLELTSLLDHELYTRHTLVVQASDSSAHNPLQTFATVELNLLDVNDHAPAVLGLYSSSCESSSSPMGPTEVDAFDRRHRKTLHEDDYSGGEAAALSVRIQTYNLNFTQRNRLRVHADSHDYHADVSLPLAYSAKVTVDAVSEFAPAGRCIGKLVTMFFDIYILKKLLTKMEIFVT